MPVIVVILFVRLFDGDENTDAHEHGHRHNFLEFEGKQKDESTADQHPLDQHHVVEFGRDSVHFEGLCELSEKLRFFHQKEEIHYQQ